LKSFRARFVIAERLANADPNNASWQRDLAVSHSKLGEVFAKQGDVEKVLVEYRAALSIVERLIAMDPTRVQWRIDAIEFHRALALHGDEPAIRFVFIASALRDLQGKVGLTAEHAEWLAEAERELAKL
jgi:hypothetical protein